MILVVAGRFSAGASDLAARWTAQGRQVALVTCADLSARGWNYLAGSPDRLAAVAGGQVLPVESISGVLNYLPIIGEADLSHIVAADRAYVATEMTAFLLAWLASLPCPVLNRPAPGCLTGPGWSQERWLATAARLDIAVLPLARATTNGAETADEARWPAAVTVTVIGERCFGTTDAALSEQARRLATAGGVALLAAHFGADGALRGVTPWPFAVAPALDDAIAAELS